MPLFHRSKKRDNVNVKSRGERLVEKYLSLVEQDNNTRSSSPESEDVKKEDGNSNKEDFAVSNCNGTKKALLIGINYTGTSAELNGCVNDAKALKEFLVDQYDFPESNIRLLTDDGEDEASHPTCTNIVNGMRWLVNEPEPNDSYFFFYSGHGTQVKDTSGDEPDGFDEAICPLDADENGVLIDDDMHELLVTPLPAGARLTAMFDCCFSGTALDLPYVYSTDGKLKNTNITKYISRNLLDAAHTYYIKQQRESAKGIIRRMSHDLLDIRHVEKMGKEQLSSAADVIMISGCKDDQYSADKPSEGHGALTSAFLGALKEDPHQTYQELLVQLRESCEKQSLRQRPQLSASHPVDLDVPFIC
ncbi:caspase domain-containing protein [Phascolomyces articulosus]|uniref:Caspase domain-containing protein n=1 Tax=Phascolomyces articulosus TaxID=60185 RepID=A0AAD5KCD5_9FUNG|nr:caspase domain-containing protein [Phascolomyces articulosus]